MLVPTYITEELDRYLNDKDRVTPGTGTAVPPVPEPLPHLSPGIPLYDKCLAWMETTWGHGSDTIPQEGKRVWNRLLRESRRMPQSDNGVRTALIEFRKWLLTGLLMESTITSSAIPDYRTTEHWANRCTLGWLISKLATFEGLRKRLDAVTHAVSIHSREGQSRINDCREKAIIYKAIHHAPGRGRISLLCDELNPSESLSVTNLVALRAKVCRAKPCSLDEANQLSLDDAADVLDPKQKPSVTNAQMTEEKRKIAWRPAGPTQGAEIYAVTELLDRHLHDADRSTVGTGTAIPASPEPLPHLKAGVPLYDETLAWIGQEWGGYDKMPPDGRRLWDMVLAASRREPANSDAALKAWAQWLQERKVRGWTEKHESPLLDPTATRPPASQLALLGASLDEQALAVFLSRNGAVTKKEIARILVESKVREKCHEKSLAPKRCPRLNTAIRAYRNAHKLPRGSKDREGNVEAYEDE
jgi:hypothetical protein